MNILDNLNPSNFGMLNFMILIICSMIFLVCFVIGYDLLDKPQNSQTCVSWEKSTMLVPNGKTVMVLPINKCVKWIDDK